MLVNWLPYQTFGISKQAPVSWDVKVFCQGWTFCLLTTPPRNTEWSKNIDWNALKLKARVPDKRLYGTGTSGTMLILVTHPTQCVAECAKCSFSGQVNMTWGPSTEFGGSITQMVPNSIWPSELHRSIRTHEMHEPEFEPYM